MANKTEPGYISTFFGSFFIAIILGVMATYWPLVIGVLCVLLIGGGLVQIFQRGVGNRKRFQIVMMVSAATLSLFWAYGTYKGQERTPANTSQGSH
jgi:hypothetical protein